MTFCYTRLLALISLVMLVASGHAFAQTNVDYDADNDNYIDVATHARLNVIRYDLDGNGTPTSGTGATAYSAAFPTPPPAWAAPLPASATNSPPT